MGLGLFPAGIDVDPGDRGSELGGTGVGDLALPDEDLLQILQFRKFGETGVRNLGAVEIQILEIREALERIKSCIGHGGVLEVEAAEVRHARDVGEPLVRHLGAGEVHPLDLRRDRLQLGELVVVEFLAHVERAEAQLGRVLCDRHQRSARLLDASDRFLHELLHRGIDLRRVGLGHGARCLRQIAEDVVGGGEGLLIRFEFGDRAGGLGSAANPEREEGGLLLGELFLVLRRHVLVVAHRQEDALEEGTLVHLAGDHGGTFVASLEDCLDRDHAQLAFGFLGAVALVALRFEHRSDKILVELALRRVGSSRQGGEGGGEKEAGEKGAFHTRGIDSKILSKTRPLGKVKSSHNGVGDRGGNGA